ncbi:hypothetical protein [Rhizobium sp. Root1220]|uniref:hypothetical protein n=1 Tax=Rhizobium sp. Root1220 TaxID=1736432 RepID=UPI0006FAE751|nr:hypothetical protein [Rhizobium sp. Root1220]KQV80007.1 hypothetical protein ASC90_25735 [Rhizobium sp. Root1220]
MADDRAVTARANFETREAADLAVEHIVQERGISRPYMFVQSAAEGNASGSKAGGEASHEGAQRDDAPFAGDVEVSVRQIPAVKRILGDLAATRVWSR